MRNKMAVWMETRSLALLSAAMSKSMNSSKPLRHPLGGIPDDD